MSRYYVQVFTDDSNVKEWEDLTPDKINHIEFKGKRYDEVRHGHWKPFDLTWGRGIYVCTACGGGCEIPTEYDKPIYEFCPFCGADMREREER